MKRLLAIFTIAAFTVACNDTASDDASASGDTTATMETTPAPDTSAASTATPMKDSVMQYKDGKVMVMTGGEWKALESAVTTTNGRKVSPNGDVSKGGRTRKMEEGMMIDKDGQMMDKDGKMMDNTGWE